MYVSKWDTRRIWSQVRTEPRHETSYKLTSMTTIISWFCHTYPHNESTVGVFYWNTHFHLSFSPIDLRIFRTWNPFPCMIGLDSSPIWRKIHRPLTHQNLFPKSLILQCLNWIQEASTISSLSQSDPLLLCFIWSIASFGPLWLDKYSLFIYNLSSNRIFIRQVHPKCLGYHVLAWLVLAINIALTVVFLDLSSLLFCTPAGRR